MFYLSRRLWNGSPVPPRENAPRAGRRLFCRPRLESLEDRMMPAVVGSVLPIAPVLSAPSPSTVTPRSGSATPIYVTVAENSPATIIDLNAAYSTVSGLQHNDGLKF